MSKITLERALAGILCSNSARILTVVCAVAFVLPAELHASPNSEEPADTFETYSGETAEQMLAQMKRLYSEVEVDVADYESLIARKAIQKLRAVAVAATSTETSELERLATKLQRSGEPAGAEMELRITKIRSRLNAVVSELLAAPGAANSQKALASVAKAKSLAEQKNIPRIEKLLDNGNVEKAAGELYQILDEINAQAIFLTGPDRREVTQPFNAILNVVNGALKKRELANASESLAKQRDDYLQLAQKSIDLANSVLTAAKAGTPPLPESPTAKGPEVFAAVAKAWQDGSLAMHRARALEWGRIAVLEGTAEVDKREDIRDVLAQLNTTMSVALPELIVIYSGKITVEETEATYLALLNSVVQLLRYNHDVALRKELESALSKLAARSTQFADKVAYERRRTQEVLRWRKRIATVQTERVKESSPGIAAVALAAGRTTQNFTGLFVPTAANAASARILSELPPIVAAMVPKVVGKDAVVTEISGMGTDGKSGLGRYEDRVYSRVTLPAELAGVYETFRADLGVDESHPPLTLDVAYALAATKHGDLKYAGGTIEKFYVEALIPRFATLPPAAMPMLGFQSLPEDKPDLEPLKHVVLRFEVQPRWVAGEYFFLDNLPKPAK